MKLWIWILGYATLMGIGILFAYCWHKLPELILTTHRLTKQAYEDLSEIVKLLNDAIGNEKGKE